MREIEYNKFIQIFDEKKGHDIKNDIKYHKTQQGLLWYDGTLLPLKEKGEAKLYNAFAAVLDPVKEDTPLFVAVAPELDAEGYQSAFAAAFCLDDGSFCGGYVPVTDVEDVEGAGLLMCLDEAFVSSLRDGKK